MIPFRPSTAPSTSTVKPFPNQALAARMTASYSSASGSKPMAKSQAPPVTTLAKTKSNSSSNLYSGANVGKANSTKLPTAEALKESARQNRVSLVARQTKFSANQPSPRTNGLMTRSATSATLPNRNRVVAFGRGAVLTGPTLSSATRTQSRQSQQNRLRLSILISLKPNNLFKFYYISYVYEQFAKRTFSSSVYKLPLMI